MRIQFASYTDITVWIESFDEFGALVAQVGLCGKVMLCRLFGGGVGSRGGGVDEGVGEGFGGCGG